MIRCIICMMVVSLFALFTLLQPWLYTTWWSLPMFAAVYCGAMAWLACVASGRDRAHPSVRAERERYRAALMGQRAK